MLDVDAPVETAMVSVSPGVTVMLVFCADAPPPPPPFAVVPTAVPPKPPPPIKTAEMLVTPAGTTQDPVVRSTVVATRRP